MEAYFLAVRYPMPDVAPVITASLPSLILSHIFRFVVPDHCKNVGPLVFPEIFSKLLIFHIYQLPDYLL
jgi:hypothetical protein